MTTTAIAGGFAVCQTRLGAKVHDPKDPGADLGPMFSQVLGTMLRLTERHAERWLDVGARTTCPSTASSAIIDPPPLEVDTRRLLQEFANGRLTVGEQWAARWIAGDAAAVVCELAADAERAVEEAARADTPSTARARCRSASRTRPGRASCTTSAWPRARACCRSIGWWRRSSRSTSVASRAS